MQLKTNFRTTVQIIIFLCIACIVPNSTIIAQKGTSDPKEAKLITTDIDNFWYMYDKLPTAKNRMDTLQILNEYYIDKASTALREYFEDERRENKRDIEKEYLEMLRDYPKYLSSIKKNTQSIGKNKGRIYKYFVRAKELYPDFRFYDTYFCVGFFNSSGRSMSKGGLYIGAEMSALSDDAELEEWKGSDWLRIFTSIDQIHNIVLHEQTHFQQLPPIGKDYNLLYDALNEGAAVFMVDVVTDGKGVTNGGAISRFSLEYGNDNEKEVWGKFKNDMLGYDQSEWFYNVGTKEWPKDMGYYVGYKICKYYYDSAKDKKRAIREILEITDPRQFLLKSQYEGKFR